LRSSFYFYCFCMTKSISDILPLKLSTSCYVWCNWFPVFSSPAFESASLFLNISTSLSISCILCLNSLTISSLSYRYFYTSCLSPELLCLSTSSFLYISLLSSSFRFSPDLSSPISASCLRSLSFRIILEVYSMSLISFSSLKTLCFS
jgi:hypothetical protein